MEKILKLVQSANARMTPGEAVGAALDAAGVVPLDPLQGVANLTDLSKLPAEQLSVIFGLWHHHVMPALVSASPSKKRKRNDNDEEAGHAASHLLVLAASEPAPGSPKRARTETKDNDEPMPQAATPAAPPSVSPTAPPSDVHSPSAPPPPSPPPQPPSVASQMSLTPTLGDDRRPDAKSPAPAPPAPPIPTSTPAVPAGERSTDDDTTMTIWLDGTPHMPMSSRDVEAGTSAYSAFVLDTTGEVVSVGDFVYVRLGGDGPATRNIARVEELLETFDGDMFAEVTWCYSRTEIRAAGHRAPVLTEHDEYCFSDHGQRLPLDSLTGLVPRSLVERIRYKYHATGGVRGRWLTPWRLSTTPAAPARVLPSPAPPPPAPAAPAPVTSAASTVDPFVEWEACLAAPQREESAYWQHAAQKLGPLPACVEADPQGVVRGWKIEAAPEVTNGTLCGCGCELRRICAHILVEPDRKYGGGGNSSGDRSTQRPLGASCARRIRRFVELDQCIDKARREQHLASWTADRSRLEFAHTQALVRDRPVASVR